MDQKSNKTSTSRVAMALVLVPALAVAVLWLGMGQLSLSAVEIQDEAVSATAQTPVAIAEVGDVVHALKSWEYTRDALTPLSPDLNTRVQRTPPAP